MQVHCKTKRAPDASSRTPRGRLWQLAAGASFLLAGLLVGAPPALAQDGTGDTVVNGCMDDLFPGNLGCTANDVRVSGVADVTGDGIVGEDDITFALVCDAGAFNAGTDCSDLAGGPNNCLASDGVTPAPEFCGDRCAFPGDTTTFAATFIVELSAQARYDIGLYFEILPDELGDGALTGTCSISTLPEVGSFTRPDGSTGDFVDLDTTCKGGNCPQPEDLCGDINNANNPIYYDLAATGNFITAECLANEEGELSLPSCTSWRQSGANEVCLTPTDAFPGSPSKCNCDPAFSVPINVPPAELQVVKTATPTSVDEPSGTVQFDIAVTNTGPDPNNNVTLNSLLDDIYGDITEVQGDILSTTCLVPQTITGNGGTYTCSFNATVSGNGGDSQTDTVTGSGVDDNGNPVEGMDDAVVDIDDVLPAISVTKTANPTTVLEGAGELVTFTVVVNNDSVADPLTLTSLMDDIHGDLNGQGDCSVPQTIALNGSYTCSFTAVVDGQAFTSETDTVTATGQDDETPANVVMASDSATVTILDDVAQIELIKTADPTQVNEPGDDVTYTFTVNNLSNVDTVTINSLTDDIYGDLNGQGDCSVPQVLAPTTGTYTCSIMKFVAGDADDIVTNVATAAGVDDDGQPVMASDDATVNVLDVAPAASLTKTVTQMIVTYEVQVSNDSSAEALTLDVLVDDEFGDITQIQGDVTNTFCATPQTIAVGGSYTCTFDGRVTVSPHVDTVTGTVSDNEGGQVMPSDSATVTFE